MLIDLRSDTVTRPGAGMRAAMADAEVGDDVYGEDPTVAQLQEQVADLLGHEAALFCPTGSLANVLAVRAIVPVGTELLCEARAHVVRAELGAHGLMSGITTRTWTGAPLDLAAIERLYAPDLGPFLVRTSAISVENTHNFAGGELIDVSSLRALRDFADERDVAVHLDGARLWHAQVALGEPLAAFGACADVVSVCLSKGLGAPVGSLVVGSASMITEARVWRKRFGAGMRQVGVLAAAGLYALEHHLSDLAATHEQAQHLADAVGAQRPHTNMVLWDVDDAGWVVEQAKRRGVLVSAVAADTVRLVTHRDLSDAQVTQSGATLAALVAERGGRAGGRPGR